MSALILLPIVAILCTYVRSEGQVTVFNGCYEPLLIRTELGSWTSKSLNSGQKATVTFPFNDDRPRVWALRGCSGNSENNCLDFHRWQTRQFNSLAEFNWKDGRLWYDISMVDGFTTGIKMEPYISGNPPECRAIECKYNVNSCKGNKILRDNKVAGCQTPNTDIISDYSRSIKQSCPNVYSYAFDNQAAKYTCFPNPNNVYLLSTYVAMDEISTSETPSPYDSSWVVSSLLNLSHIVSPSVLLIGEPTLRIVCDPVSNDDIKSESFLQDKYRLHRALFDFRTTNGFGRSIAAAQIGVNKRFLAINMGKGPYTLINPVIIFKSDKFISLWDDCMSFPFIMVRKQRSVSVSVKFLDDEGNCHVWTNLDTATSELLQHEIDHLDGILALDDPFGTNGIISREVYEKDKEYFDKQVDYVIKPTL